MRLFFSVPAIKRPSGGLKVIHDVAGAFQRAGVDVHLLAIGQAPLLFFNGPSIPTVQRSQINFRLGDIVVSSETNRSPLLGLPDFVEKWVFNQNHFYSFNQPDVPNIEDLGVSRVLCSSRTVLDFVGQYWPAVPRSLIPCAIDPDVFKGREKTLQIALMPRKRPKTARFIVGAMNRIMPEVPVVSLDMVGAEVVAARLRRSAIFLALGAVEGLGLPPLEAMSCACLVVGYPGGGGLEYATPENGLWRHDDDPLRLLDTLKDAVEIVRSDEPRYRGFRVSGRKTAARYSPEARDTAVAQLVGELKARQAQAS